MTTDTTEKGLESLIVAAMAGEPARTPALGAVAAPSALYGGTGWLLGDWHDYDREYCVDLVQLTIFLQVTQPKVGGRAGSVRGWPDAAQVPGAAARGDLEAAA